jgi:hypothetical protein
MNLNPIWDKTDKRDGKSISFVFQKGQQGWIDKNIPGVTDESLLSWRFLFLFTARLESSILPS